MFFHDFFTNDIDEVYSGEVGWDFEYTQLTAGPLGLRIKTVEIPGLRLEWSEFGQRVGVCDVMHDGIGFAVVIDALQRPTFAGARVDRDVGLIYQAGRENNYVIHPGTKTLAVTASPSLAIERGWIDLFFKHSLLRLPTVVLQSFVKVCEQLKCTAATNPVGELDATVENKLRERVLIALDAVFEQRGYVAPSKDLHSLVGRVNELMLATNSDELMSVSEIAEELEVSERAIYDAFSKTWGVGPSRYQLIRRLHRFRRGIVAGNAYHGKITEIGISCGFDHFGRLSKAYHSHFGETPRQTMRRKA